jgi:hypothetical protein
MHFMWHFFPEYRDPTMDRFTTTDGRVYLCSGREDRLHGRNEQIELARIDGYTETGIPRFSWVEKYRPVEGLWRQAVEDLEPWGPIETAWRVPFDIFTHVCDEHHPLSPRHLLFHARSACLHAIQDWIENVVAVEDRDALGYHHVHPLSYDVVRAVVGRESETRYEWRHEDVTIRTTEEGVVTGSRAWFRPTTKRNVPVFDGDGVPAGHVERVVPVCEWIPVVKKALHGLGKMPEDLTVSPDFMENRPQAPEECVLSWGDMVG